MKTKHILIGTIIIISILLAFIFFYPTKDNIKRDKSKPMSENDFETIMLNNDFIVSDKTENYKNYDYVKKAYLATNPDNDFTVEYFMFTTAKMAHTFFELNKSNINPNKEEVSSFENFNNEKTSKFVNEENGAYQILSRIEDTVVVINSTQKYKSKVDDILNKIKY